MPPFTDPCFPFLWITLSPEYDLYPHGPPFTDKSALILWIDSHCLSRVLTVFNSVEALGMDSWHRLNAFRLVGHHSMHAIISGSKASRYGSFSTRDIWNMAPVRRVQTSVSTHACESLVRSVCYHSPRNEA